MSEPQKMVKVGIRDKSGQVETLWATPLGENTYRLENSPFFAYGISWNDIVIAELDSEGFPFFIRVIEKSGYKTIRVITEKDSKELPVLLSDINKLGCNYEGAFSKLVVIDIPPEVELRIVSDFMSQTNFEWEFADPTPEQVNAENNNDES